MNITFLRSYKKLNDKQVLITVFVYLIQGSPDELDNYKDIVGEHYRVDSGTEQPVWFTTRYVGESCPLIITSKGKIVPDTTELDKARSLVDQFGGNIGHAMASEVARNLMPKHTANVPAEPVQDPDPEQPL